jgi:replicative DNA helicase
MSAHLKDHLQQMETLIDLKSDSHHSWPFHGISSGMPILDKILGPFRDGVYLFAGGASSGKTSFVSQILYNLLQGNESLIAIFFSMDCSYLDLVARYLAVASDLSVEQIRNPGQLKNPELAKQREQGLTSLRRIRDRLIILDQSHDCMDLERVEQEIRKLRDQNPGVPMMVCLDPILSISCGNEGKQESSESLMRHIKRLARQYQTGILATAHLAHGAHTKRPRFKELEGALGLVYGADLIGLLYNDSLNDLSTPYLEWEWGSEDLMVPLVEVNFVKNKNGTFLGRVFYRFYNSATRYQECSESENEYYNEMLGNLDHFDPDAKKLKSDLDKRVYVDRGKTT